MARIHLWMGRSFTGKTHQALLEGRIAYFELEPNGFKRTGLPDESSKDEADRRILIHRFRVPLTNLDVEPVVKVGASGMPMPQFTYKLEGWQPLYSDIRRALRASLQEDRIPVFDTGTRLWLIIRQAVYEQYQDAAPGAELDKLQRLIYTEPNMRIIQITEEPDFFDLDVIFIAHEDTIFGTSTLKADTYKELENMADATLRFSIVDGKPVGTIFKMGAAGGLGMIGRVIEEPTLSKVNELLDAAAKLSGLKMELPEDNTELVELAAAL